LWRLGGARLDAKAAAAADSGVTLYDSNSPDFAAIYMPGQTMLQAA
jgi:hypothetical protein